MAYENVKADAIVRRSLPAFKLNAGKTTIALRAKDFTNREDCEKLMRELSQKLNTKKFAMHDLETFVKLDEESESKAK
jgi:hypothetical protein